LLFIALSDFLYVTDVLSSLSLGLVELPFRLGVGISSHFAKFFLHLAAGLLCCTLHLIAVHHFTSVGRAARTVRFYDADRRRVGYSCASAQPRPGRPVGRDCLGRAQILRRAANTLSSLGSAHIDGKYGLLPRTSDTLANCVASCRKGDFKAVRLTVREGFFEPSPGRARVVDAYAVGSHRFRESYEVDREEIALT
jgi:hypothetical protein